MAVFTLPGEMAGFFKYHLQYLSEHSVDPDRRAHVDAGEASRHFINADHYGEDPFSLIPYRWQDAQEKYSEETLVTYGLLPWHIQIVLARLTKAFEARHTDRILYHAAHLGHYVADACTPLHTTRFYNGRAPSERGVHSLWESRIPELFAPRFDYLTGKAQYINAPLSYTWQLIEASHQKVDSIYEVFTALLEMFPVDQRFVHEPRGLITYKVFSREFSEAFHLETRQMVERQMQLAIKATGDLWFTAWVNAGQPELQPRKMKISRNYRRFLKQQRKAWKTNNAWEEQLES